MYEHATHEDEIDIAELILIWLREDLIGELEAINQYQDHIDAIDDAEIKTLLTHIRDDEKEHFAEITKMLRKLDTVQEAKFMKEGL